TTTRAKATTASKTKAAGNGAAAEKGAQTPLDAILRTANKAVDVPVGALLVAAETVKPWTGASTREKELERLRAQIERELGSFERRGVKARRALGTRVR